MEREITAHPIRMAPEISSGKRSGGPADTGALWLRTRGSRLGGRRKLGAGRSLHSAVTGEHPDRVNLAGKAKSGDHMGRHLPLPLPVLVFILLDAHGEGDLPLLLTHRTSGTSHAVDKLLFELLFLV